MRRTLATILFAERHNLWYSTHNPLESTYIHTFTTYKAWVVIYQPLPAAGCIRLGDGSDGQITGKITLSVSLNPYHSKVTLHVVDLSPAMEVVLGEPWLRQTSAHLEYGPTGLSCVHVWKGSRRMSLKPQVAQEKPKQLLLSAMQCKKLISKEIELQPPKPVDSMFGVEPDRHLIPEARLQKLPSKYGKVFQELPDGLSPDRGVDHTIPD